MKKLFAARKVTTETALIAAFAAFLIGFASTFRGLFERWTKFDEAYGHGLLIVGLFFYLVHGAHMRIAQARPAPKLCAAAPAAILGMIWLLAHIAAISIIQELLLPLIILCAWLAVAGPAVVRPLLFPVLMLYFAIPVWDYLNNSLVDLTVAVVRTLLPYWHISALVEGNAIQIPDGTVIIADGCSGLRYVITGLALSALSAKLNFRSWRARVLTLLAGLALALIANWVRVLSLVLIGHYSQMRSPLMHDHDYYGWLLFIVFMSPILAISWLAPAQRNTVNIDISSHQIPLHCLLLAVAAILLGPVIAMQLDSTPARNFQLAPIDPPEWNLQNSDAIWTPTLPPPYRMQQRTYRRGREEVTASVFAYRKDRFNEKLFPYIDSVYDKHNWRLLSDEIVQVATRGGNLSVNQLVLKSAFANGSYVIWYWFDVGGYATPSYMRAKLSQIPAQLRGRNQSLVMALAIRCGREPCSNEAASLQHFVANTDLRSSALISH